MKKHFIPFVVFAVLIALAAVPLLQGRDPSRISSAMIEKPMPDFDLPGLSSGGLPKDGVFLINFFASWCVSCAVEQPLLAKLAEKARMYGIAYKDKDEAMRQWLAENGNPYKSVAMDAKGRTAIDFGVYGVPETYIIDGKGIIRYRHAGPVTEDDYEEIFLPLIEELQK